MTGIRAAVVFYVLALRAVVVAVDVLFFRHHILGRLIVNVGIVLVFTAFYLTFLKRLKWTPILGQSKDWGPLQKSSTAYRSD